MIKSVICLTYDKVPNELLLKNSNSPQHEIHAQYWSLCRVTPKFLTVHPAKVPLFFTYSPLKCTFESTQKVSYLYGLKRIGDMSFLTPPQNGVIISSTEVGRPKAPEHDHIILQPLKSLSKVANQVYRNAVTSFLRSELSSLYLQRLPESPN